MTPSCCLTFDGSINYATIAGQEGKPQGPTLIAVHPLGGSDFARATLTVDGRLHDIELPVALQRAPQFLQESIYEPDSLPETVEVSNSTSHAQHRVFFPLRVSNASVDSASDSPATSSPEEQVIVVTFEESEIRSKAPLDVLTGDVD